MTMYKDDPLETPTFNKKSSVLTNWELRQAIKDTQLEVRNSKRYPKRCQDKLVEHLHYLLNVELHRAEEEGV